MKESDPIEFIEYMITYWNIEGNKWASDQWTRAKSLWAADKSKISNGILEKITAGVKPGNIKKVETCAMFMKIIGVGPVTAADWWRRGWRSLSDIKPKNLTHQQKLGLKYFDDIQERIPRAEVEHIVNSIKPYIHHRFEIAGSYRRGLPTSADIDILILAEDEDNKQEFKNCIQSDSRYVDYIASKTKKFQFLWKSDFHDNHVVRKIDVKFCTKDTWISSLLYFTGSAMHNITVRTRAGELGYHLNQHGLYKLPEYQRIPLNKEEDLYEILKMKYHPPSKRIL